MRSLIVPVSDASGPVFRVLSSESWPTGSAGTDRRHRVRFARFVTAPRSPVTGPLFSLKKEKSVGCVLAPVAETVCNLAGSSVDWYQVPHISTVQLSGVVVHGRLVGWPSALFVNEYNPQRLWAGAALFCGCPHEPVAPVVRFGAVPKLSTGRGYELADSGALCRSWSLCDSWQPLGLEGVGKGPTEEKSAFLFSGVGSLPETNTVRSWRRPAGRVSPRRAARLAALGLAVLVAGTLTSCTTLAPVVRCVPDSAVLPCK